MPTLEQLSEQGNTWVGTRIQDIEILSVLLNQYEWSDGNLHDVMDVGWRSDLVPGIHYIRAEALDNWRDRATLDVAYQRCVIQQIYANATDGSACVPAYLDDPRV